MQEGIIAFLSTVKISAAVRAHTQAGLPCLVYLRHPGRGGVMASWGPSATSQSRNPAPCSVSLAPAFTRRSTAAQSRRLSRSQRTSSTRGSSTRWSRRRNCPTLWTARRASSSPARTRNLSRRGPLRSDHPRPEPGNQSAFPAIRNGRTFARCLPTGPRVVLPLNGTGRGKNPASNLP